MGRPEDEIKQKLAALEASLEEAPQLPAAAKKPAAAIAVDKESSTDSLSSDLCLCGGFGLLLLGIFMVLHHVQVTSSFMAAFGFHAGGFGLSIVPLMIGIGFLFFDYKNRVGWILTAASLALIFFAVLSQLVMSFPAISMLGLVIMFLPFAAGGALIAKGMRKRRG